MFKIDSTMLKLWSNKGQQVFSRNEAPHCSVEPFLGATYPYGTMIHNPELWSTIQNHDPRSRTVIHDLSVSNLLAVKSGESKPPRKLLFFRENFFETLGKPTWKTCLSIHEKKFLFYIFTTHMWNMNITYRDKTGLLKNQKQFPYENKVRPLGRPD